LPNYNDIKVGDIIEGYREVEYKKDTLIRIPAPYKRCSRDPDSGFNKFPVLFGCKQFIKLTGI
jgi:hypothetical protein